MSAESYRTFLSVFYPFFLILSLAAQVCLLFLIIKHSPKSIHMLRYVLALTCLFQIILALSCFHNQLRMVTTRTPIEIWAYGPCRYQEPWFCYCVYQLEQLSALASGLTVYGTFYLKYKVVSGVEMSKFEVGKVYLSFYSPVIVSSILVYFIITTQTLSWETQEHLRLVNTFLNTGDYSTIASLNFQKLPNVLNLMVFTGCILCVPAISLYCRKRILRQINHQIENMSSPRQTLYRNFVMGLTIQCVLPYIFYVPIYTVYYYCLITKREVLFLEFFLVLVPALPSLVDPLVSLYFVTPYRRKMTLWIKRKREETRTTNAFTS